MGHGMPDYNRDVRPKYGGVVFKWGTLPATAWGYTALLIVTGKGMIYGGAIALDYTASQRDSYAALYVDGETVLFKSFYDLLLYNFTNVGGYPLCLTKYDDVNFVYAVQFPFGITFEKSLKFSYVEAHGGTPDIKCDFAYTLL